MAVNWYRCFSLSMHPFSDETFRDGVLRSSSLASKTLMFHEETSSGGRESVLEVRRTWAREFVKVLIINICYFY